MSSQHDPSDILVGIHQGIPFKKIERRLNSLNEAIEELRDQVKAVSYTHLTLPTILLV